MSDAPESIEILDLVARLFWPGDAGAQVAILLLAGFAALIALTVQGPLIVQLVRIGRLQRNVQGCFYDETSNSMQRKQLATAFAESPLAYHWDEFLRRWHNAIAADPIQHASLPELSRAPVRLMDVLKEHPILAAGARRSLLPALPAIFLSAGLLGVFAALVLALPGVAPSLEPAGGTPATRPQELAVLFDQLGMALRIGLWGLLLSLLAAISGRLIEGRAEVQNEALDSWVQLAYGSISAGELATRTAHEQRSSLLRLQEDLSELATEITGRSRDELAGAARAGSDANAANELLQVVERLAKGSESQSTATRSLTQTAQVLHDAAEALRSGLDELGDLVDALRATAPRGLAADAATGTSDAHDDDTDLTPLDELPAGPLAGIETAGATRAAAEPSAALPAAPASSPRASTVRLEPVAAQHAEPESLSGLLRATHHSGPFAAGPAPSAPAGAERAAGEEARPTSPDAHPDSHPEAQASAAAGLLGGSRPRRENGEIGEREES